MLRAVPGLAVGVAVAVSPGGDRLYVSRGDYPCVRGDGKQGGPLSVLDAATGRVLNTLCLRTAVGALAVSRDRDGRYLIVANGSALTVFDRNALDSSAAPLNDIALGAQVSAFGVGDDNSIYAYVPAGKRLFVFSPTGLLPTQP